MRLFGRNNSGLTLSHVCIRLSAISTILLAFLCTTRSFAIDAGKNSLETFTFTPARWNNPRGGRGKKVAVQGTKLDHSPFNTQKASKKQRVSPLYFSSSCSSTPGGLTPSRDSDEAEFALDPSTKSQKILSPDKRKLTLNPNMIARPRRSNEEGYSNSGSTTGMTPEMSPLLPQDDPSRDKFLVDEQDLGSQNVAHSEFLNTKKTKQESNASNKKIKNLKGNYGLEIDILRKEYENRLQNLMLGFEERYEIVKDLFETQYEITMSKSKAEIEMLESEQEEKLKVMEKEYNLKYQNLYKSHEIWKYSWIVTTTIFILLGHIFIYLMSKWHRNKIEKTKDFWKKNLKVITENRMKTIKQLKKQLHEYRSNSDIAIEETFNHNQRNNDAKKLSANNVNQFLQFLDKQGLSHTLQSNQHDHVIERQLRKFYKVE